MSTWLLDTSAVIRWFKQSGKRIFDHGFNTSILTVVEFPVLAAYPGFSVLYPTPAIYKKAVASASALRKIGSIIPAVDLVIASTAIERNLTLVSDDDHFIVLEKVEPGLHHVSLAAFLLKIDRGGGGAGAVPQKGGKR
ncbi:MAG: type II toxin-antitoxin system VapC family toxin [Candidatus Lokiarchaeota archaeon]|nr:type II toxin-antitoxin system VapC family toxin [Candidatus Lokiarchaeota archaeon]